MERDLIVIRIHKEDKKKLKKVLALEGRTMTSFLRMKINKKLKEVK